MKHLISIPFLVVLVGAAAACGNDGEDVGNDAAAPGDVESDASDVSETTPDAESDTEG